ncbi:MAG: 50S ribosomal protein L17 [Cytophagales bacterium]|nr:50S ribosomal protein L17 [Cytophagales bacterium]
MRHGRTFNHLGRDKDARKALLLCLTKSLIMNKYIFTTVAKAKALRKFIEPILTKSKDKSMNSRRNVFATIHDKSVVKELFDNISNVIASRPGGYCSIIKVPERPGDNASMAFMCLVDFKDTISTTER